MSNFSGTVNTNGGDLIVNLNDKEETSVVEKEEVETPVVEKDNY